MKKKIATKLVDFKSVSKPTTFKVSKDGTITFAGSTDEGKSIWRCTPMTLDNAIADFLEWNDDEEKTTAQMKKFVGKLTNPLIFKCENIPCFAGDDIFIMVDLGLKKTASTFDGMFMPMGKTTDPERWNALDWSNINGFLASNLNYDPSDEM